jgi:hypothetical protein
MIQSMLLPKVESKADHAVSLLTMRLSKENHVVPEIIFIKCDLHHIAN